MVVGMNITCNVILNQHDIRFYGYLHCKVGQCQCPFRRADSRVCGVWVIRTGVTLVSRSKQCESQRKILITAIQPPIGGNENAVWPTCPCWRRPWSNLLLLEEEEEEEWEERDGEEGEKRKRRKKIFQRRVWSSWALSNTNERQFYWFYIHFFRTFYSLQALRRRRRWYQPIWTPQSTSPQYCFSNTQQYLYNQNYTSSEHTAWFSDRQRTLYLFSI